MLKYDFLCDKKMEKNFSISDVIVLKSEDLLNEEGLSKIMGGVVTLKSSDVSSCLCKCDKKNCYQD